MWKKFFISSFFVAGVLGCGNRTALKITVQVDAAELQNEEIKSLRVLLTQNADSAFEVFDNKGEAITFPVTLSTRVDADRLGLLQISVAGLDDIGNSVLSGVTNLALDGSEIQETQVEINDPIPQNAADGIDATSCSDFIDNDGNGLSDCQEKACQQLLPGLCAGAVCGDGIVNPFANEHCDDGNTNNGDDCDANCVSNNEQFVTNLEFAQVDDGILAGTDLSFLINNPLQVKEGFVVETQLGDSDCSRLDFLFPTIGNPNVDFFFGEFGAWEFLDNNNNVVNSLTPVVGGPIFFDINGPLFQDGDQFSMRFKGDNVDQFAAFNTPKEIFPPTPFPTHLAVPEDPANLAVTRGKDFVVTWPPGPANEDAIITVFSGGVQAICKVPSDEGTVTVPAEFTAAMTRGSDVVAGTGYVLQISNGFFEKVVLPKDETTSATVDKVDGTAFLLIENGTLFNGTVF